MKKMNETDGIEAKSEQKFRKSQLLSSSRYLHKKDLINALLDEEKTYTLASVDEMIENYMKGQVN